MGIERDCNSCDRHVQEAPLNLLCSLCLRDKRTSLPYWKLDRELEEEYLRKLKEKEVG